MNLYLYAFLRAWTVTIGVETLVLIWLFKNPLKEQLVGIKLLVITSVFASSLTLPYVWFVFPLAFSGRYSVSLGFSELFAFAIEAIFYKVFLKLSLRNAFIVSFIANACSFGLGYILGHFW